MYSVQYLIFISLNVEANWSTKAEDGEKDWKMVISAYFKGGFGILEMMERTHFFYKVSY